MWRLAIIVLFAVTCAFGLPKDRFGGLESRIVGGQKAILGQFPHLAELTTNGDHMCGGTILNNRWILSAAHCFTRTGPRPELIIIRLGTTRLDKGGDSYTVDRIVLHPDFEIDINRNDLVLIRTSNEIIFSNNIQPITIADYEVPERSDVILCGWGRTKWELHPTEKYKTKDLMFVTLRTIPLEECQRRMAFFRPVFDNQMCTLVKMGVGVCFGDSGGPLIHNGNLVGTVSWGVTCANGFPDVFSKVSDFQDWIDATIAIE